MASGSQSRTMGKKSKRSVKKLVNGRSSSKGSLDTNSVGEDSRASESSEGSGSGCSASPLTNQSFATIYDNMVSIPYVSYDLLICLPSLDNG